MLLLTLAFALPLLTHSRYHRFQHNPRSARCQCLPPRLCGDDEVTVDGHGLLDPRESNSCPNPKEVCCSNIQKIAAEETGNELPRPRCGVSSSASNSRISSGTTTAFGELPWNLIIQESAGDKSQNVYKCGASLIHPRAALTAAHCVGQYAESPERILVRAGEWDINSRGEPLPFQDNFVEEILIYYDYQPLSLRNDIALLILAEEFRLTDNVRVVCLSTPDERVVENACVASGWGKNANDGKYSSILKKVTIPVVSRERCLEILRGTRLGPRYLLHKSFVCAGGRKNEDSCKGDGGSPLICPLMEDKERFVQVGIVSWGIGCGTDGVPGVYVNVPLYLDWIEAEMGERGLDTSYFKV